MNHAEYKILEITPTLILIEDTGRHHTKSVTNDAEWVVQQICKEYGTHRRIDYIDSMGQRDQLVHTNGVFTGFAPGAMY